MRRLPLLLLAAAAAAYLGCLSAPFLFDDAPAIAENPSIRHLARLGAVLRPPPGRITGSLGRPLVNLSLALDYALGRLDPRVYHATNLAVHLLAALALYGLVRRVALRARPGRPPQEAALLAFAASLLWALHPLLTEAVTCVIQRTESMMGMFYLLTLYCFVRYAEGRWIWAVCSVVSCLCGMATKEAMVSAPLLVLLLDRTYYAGTFGEAWRRRRSFYFALASTWILLAALVAGEGGRRGATAGFGLGLSPAAYAVTQVWAIARYLRLSFWPAPLILDYGTYQARLAGVLPQALLLAALLAAVIAALLRPSRWGPGARIFGLAGALFFAVLAPSSSFLPLVAQTVAEHRMYLPLAALAVLTALAAERAAGRAGLALCLAASVGLGALTVRRNRDYRSEVSVWSDTVAKWPKNGRARCNLGLALAHQGRSAAAEAEFRESLRLDPGRAETWLDWGNLLRRQGRLQEAALRQEKAVGLDPDSAVAHYNLALTWQDAGRPEAAGQELRAALRLDPSLAEAHLEQGNAYFRAGDLPAAGAEFARAAELKPGYAEADNNLGNVWLKSGRAGEAIDRYRRALAEKAGYAEAHFNLGLALKSVGRPGEASAEFQEARRLDPRLPAPPAH